MSHYSQSLSTILSTEDIPDGLGFIESAAETILSHTYFDNLEVKKSTWGDMADYKLDLRCTTPIAFQLPYTDLRLLVNNRQEDETQEISSSGETSFKMEVSYKWAILRYLPSFSLANFSFDKRIAISALNSIWIR